MHLRNHFSSFRYNVSLRGEAGCQAEAQRVLGLSRNCPPRREPVSPCLRSGRTSAVLDCSSASPPASLRRSSREGDASRQAVA